MVTPNTEKSALLIIDMVKDNFEEDLNLPITPLAGQIIDPINALIQIFRHNQWPIVFSTDAFQRLPNIMRGKAWKRSNPSAVPEKYLHP